jgi:hypothetical protein
MQSVTPRLSLLSVRPRRSAPVLLTLALACQSPPSEVVAGFESSSGTSWGMTYAADAADGVTSDGDADEGVVFLVCPDVCEPSCSTFTQDCPRGHKCMPYSDDGGSAWNATRCVPIAEPPRGVGQRCRVVGSALSGEDDCDGTSMCWRVDPQTLAGVCVPFCQGTPAAPTCPDPCDRCSFSESAPALCFSQCDPLIQDCAPAAACLPWLGSFFCSPLNTPEGTGIGDPCESLNGCPPGLVCQPADEVPGCASGSCCTSYCPRDDIDPCPDLLPGTTCAEVYEQWPPRGCPGGPTGLCLQQ